jgi:hypothetical protein
MTTNKRTPYRQWHDGVDVSMILSELFVTNESDVDISRLIKVSDWAANIKWDLDRLPEDTEDLRSHIQDALADFSDDRITEICDSVERTVESFMDGMARGEHLY